MGVPEILDHLFPVIQKFCAGPQKFCAGPEILDSAFFDPGRAEIHLFRKCVCSHDAVQCQIRKRMK